MKCRPTVRKPRCFLVYALAPESVAPAEANRIFNEYLADPQLPLVLFHDHFIGQPGGVAIFFVGTAAGRQALYESAALADWHVEVQPLIFSHSPSAFDEQISFTLRAYRNADWELLQKEKRPTYGNPRREAETASEDQLHGEHEEDAGVRGDYLP
ncbi:MAG TPA: hypothetical protein VF177_06100 [Anaerolineae bacterium]